VVVPPSRARARIAAAIEGISQVPEQEILEKSEIEALLRRRLELRERRDFAAADEIRNQLIVAGVDVRDHAI